MKKALPYILGLLALLLLATLFLLLGKSKRLDERITLNKKDKIPYGTYVAYNQLKYIFPKATITVNKKEPGYWNDDVLDYKTGKQALIIIAKKFNASNVELTELFEFVRKGNDVFISSYEFSYDSDSFFHLNSSFGGGYYDGWGGPDSLKLSLARPPYYQAPDYVYPGKRYHSYFGKMDTGMTYVMGRTKDSALTFVKLKAGTGNFYVHSAPLAFSNYFLLHKGNITYYNKVLSSIPWNTTRVVWDEYYLHKPADEQEKPDRSPFRVLMSQPAFRAGIYTALAALLIFVLLGLKRSQRMIPVITPLVNDSLDFVKTIGRLYFQKKDNQNLASKMGSFFLEYAHSHFHLTTNTLDADFATRLSQKSGAELPVVNHIIDYIKFVQEKNALTDQQLIEFYTLLDKFYKTV